MHNLSVVCISTLTPSFFYLNNCSQRFGDVFQGGLECDAAKRKVQCEILIEKALEQADSARLQKKQRREEEQAKSDSINGETIAGEKVFEEEEEVQTKVQRPRRRNPARRY